MDFFDDLRYSLGHGARRSPYSIRVACCTPVRADALDEDQAELLAQSFAALADPIRLRLLSFITSAEDEVCACDLVEPSGRSQPTVSHHMKILVDAGLVAVREHAVLDLGLAVPQRLDALRAGCSADGGTRRILRVRLRNQNRGL